ncbi:hypothetical protein KSP40_PGU018956 [Platanthera guangdongensis]|uniref:Uncharacterized protein n=1 Tax=Platanthera guangdongensis TaxID=2320717 RepID=A0ABR2LJA4_9ASPA
MGELYIRAASPTLDRISVGCSLLRMLSYRVMNGVVFISCLVGKCERWQSDRALANSCEAACLKLMLFCHILALPFLSFSSHYKAKLIPNFYI